MAGAVFAEVGAPRIVNDVSYVMVVQGSTGVVQSST